ncbi:hypothetical protein [Piscirickettsia litoralis]|uniref:Uncharacterized protein n=1 Tax=Piscirickettsia litoralis TaxID=1891921 RepID=A0ABX3A1G0_9GAMM|nr:hypothetical protein [Piscirickettsia litoralis]ODN41468.1 hypothetical protein BGC07_15215 [Piscirickettsia litoralis]
MSDLEKNYNFEDDQKVNETIESSLLESDSTVERNSKDTVQKRILSWDKIKPVLHYYIIAIIAFSIAGYMMYSAYQALYPKQKTQPLKGNSLTFSSQIRKTIKGFCRI